MPWVSASNVLFTSKGPLHCVWEGTEGGRGSVLCCAGSSAHEQHERSCEHTRRPLAGCHGLVSASILCLSFKRLKSL